MNMVGLVADAATTIQNETEQITKFFSWTHLKEMLNALGNWSVSLIGTIIISIIALLNKLQLSKKRHTKYLSDVSFSLYFLYIVYVNKMRSDPCTTWFLA